ncbi:MAG: AMP-binding protein [Defluviicoccus sp.]
MNVARLLVRAGGSAAERPALYEGPALRASYGDLCTRVATLAGQMRGRLGLNPGDRVALVMANCCSYVEVLFAAWHAGLVAVPINAKLHPKELAYILDHAAARVAFASADLAPGLSVPALRAIIDVDGREYASLVTDGTPAPLEPRQPDDTAWLFYTSGTTGRPKGAMLSHRNLLAMTLSYFADVDAIAADDCIVHHAPMSHGSGMYILPHVAAVAAQVVPESHGFDPDEVFALLACHRGVSFFAAPTMVRRLIDSLAAEDADTANLKTIVYGGGPMYVADCKRAIGLFGPKLVQIYGQGESPMTITCLSKRHHTDRGHPRHEARLASVGVPHAVVEVMVADANDRPLQCGATGEVLVRGETVMTGYWRNPDATAETLRGGWLHTGDLGALDGDGFLTLKDRSKDVIISGGANIYPREVEEILLQHEGVAEASVVGQADPEWGETVVAFVVTQPGATVAPDALERLCLDHLARFKRPKDYHFIAALPKNNTGKVLRTELRKLLDET